MCQPYRVEETTCSRCGEVARFVNILDCKKTDSQLEEVLLMAINIPANLVKHIMCLLIVTGCRCIHVCIAVFVFYLGRAAVTRSGTPTPRRPTEVICVRNAAQDIRASSRPSMLETRSPGIAKTRPTSYC